MTHLSVNHLFAFNVQATRRENLTLCLIEEDWMTPLLGEVIEPGYCIDAPSDMPAGACSGMTPILKSGLPAKRPIRNWVTADWTARP